MFCAKQIPHKICNSIFLNPTKKGISYHLFYNIIIVQVGCITIETKEVSCIRPFLMYENKKDVMTCSFCTSRNDNDSSAFVTGCDSYRIEKLTKCV
jgi:hypothetical protein